MSNNTSSLTRGLPKKSIAIAKMNDVGYKMEKRKNDNICCNMRAGDDDDDDDDAMMRRCDFLRG